MYTMMQVCREVNISYENLKYYCNEGLVPNVKRDKNNRRIFDEHDVAWIKDLTCLKRCRLSIKEMKEYLAMCLEGKDSIPRRQEFLKAKDEELQKEIAELTASRAYIEWKQNLYHDILAGTTEYKSNLIRKS